MIIEDMCNLESKMEESEFKGYTEGGCFTVRKSDKASAGLLTDQVIEQTLNRYFGVSLKHGRGVSASVVARFLLPMPSVIRLMKQVSNMWSSLTAE